MKGNHLHIWPREKFMMIALPNQDGTWTVTLFLPHNEFAKLKTKERVLEFFKNNFPDSLSLIGEENIVHTVLSTKPSQLMSVKLSKYNYGSNVIVIGDAAHAMVPFYGQGMNAGFEDCRILDEFLHNYGYTVEEALNNFSVSRNPNVEAICDLAMYNYLEMRDLINRPSFRLRKFFDCLFHRIAPTFWFPLYNSVTFSNLDYHQCSLNKKWQDSIFRRFWIILIIAAISGFVFNIHKLNLVQ